MDSMLAQKNKNFNLYIGDDNSPEDLYSIIKLYEKDLNIFYHRFNENVGRNSLTKQWKRCIDLTQDEPWLWLFADDDLVDCNCVDGFYHALEIYKNQNPDIFRFPNEIINENGEIIVKQKILLEKESSMDFIKSRFAFQKHSYASEYVFSRQVYNKFGFVDFPLAWNADDAAWAMYAKERGFFTISTGKVQWRASGQNISSTLPAYYSEKIRASFLYLDWVKENFRDIVEEQGFVKIKVKWLAWQFMNTKNIVPFRQILNNSGKLISCLGFFNFFYHFIIYSLQVYLKSKRTYYLDKFIFGQKVFIGFSYAQHGIHSGYDMLFNYLKYTRKITSERNLMLTILLKFKSILSIFIYFDKWYFRLVTFLVFCKTKFYRKSILHFIYPESFITSKNQVHPTNKIVATFHLPPETYEKLDEKLKEKHLEVDHAIVLSEELKNFWIQKLGAEKVTFIPHGIDTDYFKPGTISARQNRIILVGNWLRNFELAAKVFKLLHEKRPDIELTVVSLPTNRSFFTDLPFVRFISGISDDELLEFYQTSKILFLPLKAFAANNAILEAAACGCEIFLVTEFSSECYFNHDQIHIIHQPPEQIVEILMDGIDHFDQQKQLSVVQFVNDNYSWQKIAEKTNLVFKKVIVL